VTKEFLDRKLGNKVAVVTGGSAGTNYRGDNSCDPSKISPDNWVIDQAYMDRPGNKEIQLSILYNAKRNLDVYADWQEYFRKQQPPR